MIGDVGFNPPILYLTMQGVNKLIRSRIRVAKPKDDAYELVNHFNYQLYAAIESSFARDCILIQKLQTNGAPNSIPTVDDYSSEQVINAWRYHRMMADRLQLLCNNNNKENNLLLVNNNKNEENNNNNSLFLINSDTIVNSLPPPISSSTSSSQTNTQQQQSQNQSSSSSSQSSSTSSLLIDSNTNPLLSQNPSPPQQSSQPQSSSSQPISSSSSLSSSPSHNNNITTSITPSQSTPTQSPIPLQQQQSQSSILTATSSIKPQWNLEFIKNTPSSMKKGKRCPICGTLSGNSKKVCSVCSYTFPKGKVDKTCILIIIYINK